MDGYKVEILESSKELTAKERIQLKDTTNAVALDDATKGGNKVVITPVAFAILKVHNEKSDTKDYQKYIIEDKDGTKYITGSAPLWSTFKAFWDELETEDEAWSVEVYSMPSKNYKDKAFLTCSVL
jgi:hypothetical protein